MRVEFSGKEFNRRGRAEGVSEPRAVATGLGTQSSRLPSKSSMTHTQAVGTTAYPDTARGSETTVAAVYFSVLLLRSDGHEARFATAIDQQERRLISAFVDGGAQVGGRANRLPVHFLNNVGPLNTGGRRRSGRID